MFIDFISLYKITWIDIATHCLPVLLPNIDALPD